MVGAETLWASIINISHLNFSNNGFRWIMLTQMKKNVHIKHALWYAVLSKSVLDLPTVLYPPVLTIHAKRTAVGGQLRNSNVILEKPGQHDFFIKASCSGYKGEPTASQCKQTEFM